MYIYIYNDNNNDNNIMICNVKTSCNMICRLVVLDYVIYDHVVIDYVIDYVMICRLVAI